MVTTLAGVGACPASWPASTRPGTSRCTARPRSPSAPRSRWWRWRPAPTGAFIAAAVVAGSGFGTSFLGIMRSITPVVAPDERRRALRLGLRGQLSRLRHPCRGRRHRGAAHRPGHHDLRVRRLRRRPFRSAAAAAEVPIDRLTGPSDSLLERRTSIVADVRAHASPEANYRGSSMILEDSWPTCSCRETPTSASWVAGADWSHRASWGGSTPRRVAWTDVGCGTGALTAAVLEHASPASSWASTRRRVRSRRPGVRSPTAVPGSRPARRVAPGRQLRARGLRAGAELRPRPGRRGRGDVTGRSPGGTSRRTSGTTPRGCSCSGRSGTWPSPATPRGRPARGAPVRPAGPRALAGVWAAAGLRRRGQHRAHRAHGVRGLRGLLAAVPRRHRGPARRTSPRSVRRTA